MALRKKLVGIPEGLWDSIAEIKERYGYPTDNETIRALLIAGISKIQPEYVRVQAQRMNKTAPKDPIEEARTLCTGFMKGTLVDMNGNKDTNGGYCSFAKYEVMPGNPRKVMVVQEKQPLTELESEKHYKYRGGSVEEIEEIILDPERIIRV
jgi:hypothetical protein